MRSRRENASERAERFEAKLQKDLGMSVTNDETRERSSRKSRREDRCFTVAGEI